MAISAGAQSAVATELAALDELNIDGLRDVWRGRFGAPPPVRAADVMRRCLAERIQLEAFGSDAMLDKELDRFVAAYERGRGVSLPKGKLRAGTVLVREHGGRTYRVEVLADGFAWDGQTWKSLSEIAREITGVRWNGPRFFGLRAEEAKS